MKINTIISQYRRDFTVIYECEHCGDLKTSYGYDDSNFHRNVIPQMECSKCGKKSSDSYRLLTPKYSEHTVV